MNKKIAKQLSKTAHDLNELQDELEREAYGLYREDPLPENFENEFAGIYRTVEACQQAAHSINNVLITSHVYMDDENANEALNINWGKK